MEQRSHELLEQLSVTIPSVRGEVGTLSGGQRQQVAVAARCSGEPKVVLLDEPTAALGVAQTAQVLALIKRLRERNLGVIVISHNLADVFEVADRIFVLRLGRGRRIFEAEATTEEEVVGRSPARSTTTPPNSGGSREDRQSRRSSTRGAGARASPRATCCGASCRATSPRCG